MKGKKKQDRNKRRKNEVDFKKVRREEKKRKPERERIKNINKRLKDMRAK